MPFSITTTDDEDADDNDDDDAAAAREKIIMRAFYRDIYFHMLNLHTFWYCMHIINGILNAVLHVVKIVCCDDDVDVDVNEYAAQEKKIQE